MSQLITNVLKPWHSTGSFLTRSSVELTGLVLRAPELALYNSRRRKILSVSTSSWRTFAKLAVNVPPMPTVPIKTRTREDAEIKTLCQYLPYFLAHLFFFNDEDFISPIHWNWNDCEAVYFWHWHTYRAALETILSLQYLARVEK